MKNRKFIPGLPLLAAAFSLAGFCLRMGLYALALDIKNLLIPNHPLEMGLWAVMLLGAAVILVSVRKESSSGTFEENFVPSLAAGLGQIFLGVCILATVLSQPAFGLLGMLWRITGFLTAPALVWGGICRRQGKRPFFGIHGIACVFLLLHMVCQYQYWSGNPQIQDFVFELLAAVSLTLFCYHCASFEAGSGSRQRQLASGLLTVLLSGPALSGTAFPALYLGGAVFAATNLCVRKRPRKGLVNAHDPS